MSASPRRISYPQALDNRTVSRQTGQVWRLGRGISRTRSLPRHTPGQGSTRKSPQRHISPDDLIRVLTCISPTFLGTNLVQLRSSRSWRELQSRCRSQRQSQEQHPPGSRLEAHPEGSLPPRRLKSQVRSPRRTRLDSSPRVSSSLTVVLFGLFKYRRDLFRVIAHHKLTL